MTPQTYLTIDRYADAIPDPSTQWGSAHIHVIHCPADAGTVGPDSPTPSTLALPRTREQPRL